MPKPEKIRNRNHNEAIGPEGDSPTPAASDPRSLERVFSLQTEQGRLDAASFAFQSLLARTDGWLRCIPSGHGKQNYFKWKFNTGQHSGKYVMFVSEYSDWVSGIMGLFYKLEEVDEGMRKPAHDTFYDPR